MRSSLFWDVTQRRLVVIYRRFGTIYRSDLQRSDRNALPLKISPIDCPETSINYYQSKPSNTPEERISQACSQIFLPTFCMHFQRSNACYMPRPDQASLSHQSWRLWQLPMGTTDYLFWIKSSRSVKLSLAWGWPWYGRNMLPCVIWRININIHKVVMT